MAGIPWSPHGRVGALDTQDWASWDITRAECCSHRGRAARREGCHRAGARALSGMLSFSPAHGGGTWHACLRGPAGPWLVESARLDGDRIAHEETPRRCCTQSKPGLWCQSQPPESYNDCHIAQSRNSLGRKTPAVFKNQPEILMCSSARTPSCLWCGCCSWAPASWSRSRVQPVRNHCDTALQCPSSVHLSIHPAIHRQR